MMNEPKKSDLAKVAGSRRTKPEVERRRSRGARAGRGEREPAKHEPDAVPGPRVTGAGARAPSSKVKKARTVHCAAHHINLDLLRMSFYALKRSAAPESMG